MNNFAKLTSSLFKFSGEKHKTTTVSPSSFSALSSSIERYRDAQAESKKNKEAEANQKMKELQTQQSNNPKDKMMENFKNFASRTYAGASSQAAVPAVKPLDLSGGPLPKTASEMRNLSVSSMICMMNLNAINKKFASIQNLLNKDNTNEH